MEKKDRVTVVISLVYFVLPLIILTSGGRNSGSGFVLLMIPLIIFWGYKYIKDEHSDLKYYSKKLVLIVSIMVVGVFISILNQLDATKAKLEDVKSKVVDLTYSVDNLKSSVNNFSYYDWKDVVPEVDSKTREVSDKVEQLNNDF